MFLLSGPARSEYDLKDGECRGGWEAAGKETKRANRWVPVIYQNVGIYWRIEIA
jgi:hypothetical protein